MEHFTANSPHRPLSSSDIRLVKLYPGRIDDPIRCELEHVSLDSADDFTALSYTWGDPCVTRPILLNCQEYPVTLNLHSFLSHMQAVLHAILFACSGSCLLDMLDEFPGLLPEIIQRIPVGFRALSQSAMTDFLRGIWCGLNEASIPSTEYESETVFDERFVSDTEGDHSSISLHLWIDALSINQTDLDERNAQVHRMRDIYGRASRVYVWLGGYEKVQEDDITIAFSHISSGLRHVVGLDSDINQRDTSSLSETELTALWRRTTSTLLEVYRLPWFEIMWIIQEFATAAGIVIAWVGFSHIPCGQLVEVAPKMVRDAALHFCEGEKWMHAYWNNADALRKLRKFYKESITEHQQHSIPRESVYIRYREVARRLRLLLRQCTVLFKTTDKRDRLYSLLGLAITGDMDVPCAIRPDYTRTVAEVYQQYASYLFVVAGALEFLPAVPNRLSEAPSWVPDWSETNMPSLAKTEAHHIRIVNDGLGLEIVGFLFGKVVSVPKAPFPQLDDFLDLPDHFTVSELAPTLGQRLKELERFYFQKLRKIEPEASFDDFTRRWMRLWEEESTLGVWEEYSILVGRSKDSGQPVTPVVKGMLYMFLKDLVYFSDEESLAILSDGGFMRVPRECHVKTGDNIFMIKGVARACLLRYNGSTFRLIGTCQQASFEQNLGIEIYEQHDLELIVLT